LKQTKETIGQHAERERAMAKALSMSILFEADTYWKIIQILDKKTTTNADEIETELYKFFKSKLDDADAKWAANYLKNYDKELAANSDKKWPVHPEASNLHW
jgi:hypothetical protein